MWVAFFIPTSGVTILVIAHARAQRRDESRANFVPERRVAEIIADLFIKRFIENRFSL